MNGIGPHHFFTDPTAKATKDTILVISLEPNLIHSHLPGHILNQFIARTHSQDEFDNHPPSSQYFFRMGENFYPLQYGISAGSGHPRPSLPGYLHKTEAACAIGFDRLMKTKVWNVDACIQCDFQDVRTFFPFNGLTINGKGYHTFSHFRF
jgi:hypothetical protein